MKLVRLTIVQSDLWRHNGRTGFIRLLWAILHNRTFAPVATLRMLQNARKYTNPLRIILLPILSLFHRWTTQRAAIDLPKDVRIGPGFRITHGWGMVFNKGAVLGSNVTVMHGVTLGGKADRYPRIGNNVFIGAHAIVLGGVVVGDGAVIGPGCVVTKDVPAGTTVVGNPQREIGPVVEPMGNFLVPAAMLPKIDR
ncbi:MAG: DapH/DapD/GlmU-related protein [Gallionellaceae bacterium]|nr:DapH/DapD/GlmU-related protein [Gallionellaceae bacterium]